VVVVQHNSPVLLPGCKSANVFLSNTGLLDWWRWRYAWRELAARRTGGTEGDARCGRARGGSVFLFEPNVAMSPKVFFSQNSIKIKYTGLTSKINKILSILLSVGRMAKSLKG
jgi:hypothetical protein